MTVMWYYDIICYFTADTCSKFSHLEGRRVVDLPFVISLLEKGCTVCQHKLHLSYYVGEEKSGLASVLKTKCSTCGMLTKIGTSDTHTPAGGSDRGRRPYDVNTKAAFATMVSGIGITQANRFLAVLNIPQMTHRNSKKRERDIGAVVERLANQSCMEACAIERHLTRSSNESPELQDPPSSVNNGTDISAPLLDPATLPEHATTPTSSDSQPQLDPATVGEPTTPTSSDSQPLLDPATAGEPTTPTSSDNRVPVVASYDYGWAKRGRR